MTFTEPAWMFDEPLNYPSRPYDYDFRKNDSYKSYRKRINKITLKKPDEKLADEFHNAIKKHYFLTEKNAQEVGMALLSLRNSLPEKQLLSKKLEQGEIVISKGITMPAYQEEGYGDELMLYTAQLWGCVCIGITSGKKEPSVFCGLANNVHLAYQSFCYIDAFLSDEAEKFIETCHKNTKKSNKYLKAGYYANDLLSSKPTKLLRPAPLRTERETLISLRSSLSKSLQTSYNSALGF